ncbi:excitatory amino acid transporter-like [Tubulanus polymorphus]|uniref:excitatory amino acid transporter-like n=1 Tax=Tubulanus polymorphus TaxID=672921 RepID=UPI003DA4C846
MDKIQCKEWLKENLLLLLAIAGVAVGFIIGFSLMGLALSEEVLIWIEMPGIIFLRLLTMMIVPLVISSIISGCSSLDPRLNGKMGLYTFIYVFVNNVIGCLIGFAIVYAIKPETNVRRWPLAFGGLDVEFTHGIGHEFKF